MMVSAGQPQPTADVMEIAPRLAVIAAVSLLLMLGPLGFTLGLIVAPLLVLAESLTWRARHGEDAWIPALGVCK